MIELEDTPAPGIMVRLIQKHMHLAILGRSRPELPIFSTPDAQGFRAVESNVACTIPAGSLALFVSSKVDTLRVALSQSDTRPFGFKRKGVVHYLVVWEGKPLWVCSSDVVLEEVKT